MLPSLFCLENLSKVVGCGDLNVTAGKMLEKFKELRNSEQRLRNIWRKFQAVFDLNGLERFQSKTETQSSLELNISRPASPCLARLLIVELLKGDVCSFKGENS